MSRAAPDARQKQVRHRTRECEMRAAVVNAAHRRRSRHAPIPCMGLRHRAPAGRGARRAARPARRTSQHLPALAAGCQAQHHPPPPAACVRGRAQRAAPRGPRTRLVDDHVDDGPPEAVLARQVGLVPLREHAHAVVEAQLIPGAGDLRHECRARGRLGVEVHARDVEDHLRRGRRAERRRAPAMRRERMRSRAPRPNCRQDS